MSDRFSFNRVINPAEQDVYFETDQTAYPAGIAGGTSEFNQDSTQPNIDDGVVKGVRTADITSGLLNGVIPGHPGGPILGTEPKLVGLSITGVLSGGTFAYQAAGEYIINGFSTLINGSTNNTFRSAGNDYGIRRSIHQRESVRTALTATAIRNGQWHVTSGIFDPAQSFQNDMGTWETRGTDDAANPSQAVPGELVYYHGSGISPVLDDYKPKTMW